MTPAEGWVVGLVLLFGAVFCWRDAYLLRALNFSMILGTAAALHLATQSHSPAPFWAAQLRDYTRSAGLTFVDATVGLAPVLYRDVQIQRLSTLEPAATTIALGRGALVALPILFVFGSLLIAADSAFESVVSGLFQLDLGPTITHLLVAAFFAWISGGLLRSYLLPRGSVPVAAPAGPSLGLVEISVVLTLVDLLFLGFVLVQLQYFFGGSASVVGAGSLTYAEYARRGFFELVAVAGLVLVLLLGADALRKPSAGPERLFRLPAAAQVVLVFAIMASAMQRMLLYQREYGLTELRLYTTAFMGWLALVLIWFAATILRGRTNRFPLGVLLSGIATAAILNVGNPDAIIARTNLERAHAGRSLDVAYLSTLSADAVPLLISSASTLTAETRAQVARAVLSCWALPGYTDWRTWNWARARAERAVQENAAKLVLWSRAAPVPNGCAPSSLD
ncbi:MAG: DUF4173 domain-containing protein [Acidobacteria bacterium]|nr:DUF4173 domain-containing protein [Acidobacteriota bacterium]